MDTLEYFRTEKNKHVRSAQEIVQSAETRGEPLNLQERAEIEKHTAEAHDYQSKIQTELDSRALQEQIAKLGEDLATEVEQADAVKARTVGDAFVQAEGYKALISSKGMSGSWRTGQVEFMSAAGDPVLESTGTNDDALAQQFIPRLFTPGLFQPKLTLADLFAQGIIEQGNSIRYPKATVRNAPSDAATAEAEDKPGAEFEFDDTTETLDKLAAFIPVSEEMLEDSTIIRDYINAQLPLMVRQAEETKFATKLYDDAAGLGSAGDLGGSNGFDAIAAGIADVQVTSGEDPDALFIHPLDWWQLGVGKAEDAGTYFSGGPYAGPNRNPWGLRTVISQSSHQGFPIVGAFQRGGQVWRKGGVRLEASNSHLDYFRKNKVAIRAEERVLLALYYPEMFAVVTLGS